METDRHYFFEGLFIIGFSIAAAFCAVWLGKSGNRDDVLYRIHFSESVSGLSVGDLVKYHGVDVGSVKTMALDPADSRQVQVDVSLRKDAPVKVDTKAKLTLKGITGVVYIELTGGNPDAASLPTAMPEGQIPEIPAERSSLDAILEKLPKLIDKFSSLGDQAKNVLTDVHEVTTKVKENPSLLIWGPKEKPAEKKTLRK
jgi:phospholipid/cholesterol/gamma-HCH transport system substrate-binding protein